MRMKMFEWIKARWDGLRREEQLLTQVVIGVGLLLAAGTWAVSLRGLDGDELRYVDYAINLTEGHYVSKEHPDFTNGPGLPLLLYPFVALDLPIGWARGLTVLFQLGTLIFVYRFLRGLKLSLEWCYAGALGVVFNPILLRYSGQICTEHPALFFFAGFLWCLGKAWEGPEPSWKWLVRAGLFFFALAMVRVLFGYVATAMVVLAGVGWLAGRRWWDGRVWVSVAAPFVVALVCSMPYLAYTKHHTGVNFCWSTNGGELLYFITSGNPGDLGSWVGVSDFPHRPGAAEAHLATMQRIESLPFLEREAAWKEAAKANIAANPGALPRNLAANVSRILFSFPRSFYPERLTTLFWVIPGMTGVLLGLLAIYPTVRGWRQIPGAIAIGGMVALLFGGASILLPAEPRYLLPLTPVFAAWLVFVYSRFVRIRWYVEPGRELVELNRGRQKMSLESPSKAA